MPCHCMMQLIAHVQAASWLCASHAVGVQLGRLLVLQQHNAFLINLCYSVLQEVETTVAAKLAELGSGLQQELPQLAATSRSCMSNLVQGLQDKAATITAMKERFDAHLNAAWQEYGEMYGQLSAVQQELQLHIEKKQRSYKRKLAQVQQEAAGMLAEAERKVDRKRSTVEARLPSLAAMLQTLA
eukprot:GHRR01029280.1.p3 GENE.GHRR01029280.1~~GHRR01029280.1.p3  ORF type:complete len:185 (+),score=93.50 GHRR01029280.1:1059-1613(+)